MKSFKLRGGRSAERQAARTRRKYFAVLFASTWMIEGLFSGGLAQVRQHPASGCNGLRDSVLRTTCERVTHVDFAKTTRCVVSIDAKEKSACEHTERMTPLIGACHARYNEPAYQAQCTVDAALAVSQQRLQAANQRSKIKNDLSKCVAYLTAKKKEGVVLQPITRENACSEAARLGMPSS